MIHMDYTMEMVRSTEHVSISAGDVDRETFLIGRIREACVRDGHYDLSLNYNDAADIVTALFVASQSSGDPEFADRMDQLISSIASTVNVELI
jgi:hypothetical protein